MRVILHPDVATQTLCFCPHGDGGGETIQDVQEPFSKSRSKTARSVLQNKRAQNLLQVKLCGKKNMFVVLKTSRHPAASD